MHITGQPPAARALARSLEKVAKKNFRDNPWGARHADAFDAPRGVERPIVALATALVVYADTHRATYRSNIAEDGVLGDDGFFPMLVAFRALLNGDLGRLDGSTLDALVIAIADAAGYAADALDRNEPKAR